MNPYEQAQAKLKEACQLTRDKLFFGLLTAGQTLVDGEWLYLNYEKYKGKGRPRKEDYSKSQPLYINNYEPL